MSPGDSLDSEVTMLLGVSNTFIILAALNPLFSLEEGSKLSSMLAQGGAQERHLYSFNPQGHLSRLHPLLYNSTKALGLHDTTTTLVLACSFHAVDRSHKKTSKFYDKQQIQCTWQESHFFKDFIWTRNASAQTMDSNYTCYEFHVVRKLAHAECNSCFVFYWNSCLIHIS